MKKKINKIVLIQEVDTNPDFSYLGKYTDELTEYCIVRKFGEFYCKLTDEQKEEIPERGREYRAFISENNGEKEGTEDFFKYALQNYERMESYNSQEWWYIGIGAKAQIEVGGILQNITSGSLFGIESDSDKGYIKEVVK